MSGNQRATGWCCSFLVVYAVTGVVALYFASCTNLLAAVIALTLSLSSGGVGVGLLVMRSSAKRIRADMQVRIIEKTLACFIDELEAPFPKETDSKGAVQRA